MNGGFSGGLKVFTPKRDLKLVDLSGKLNKAWLYAKLFSLDPRSYSASLKDKLVSMSRTELGGSYDGLLCCENDNGDSDELEIVLFDIHNLKLEIFENQITSLVERQWYLIDSSRAKVVLGGDYEPCVKISSHSSVLLDQEKVADVLERRLKTALPDLHW